MNLIELSYYLQNEEASREYLLQKGILKTFTHCPYCNSEKIGNIRRDRINVISARRNGTGGRTAFLNPDIFLIPSLLGY
jgi:hypothetical protein